MEVREFLSKYKYKFQGLHPNQWQTNPNEFRLKKCNVDEFNSILTYLRTTNLNTITRTKSGAIGKGKQHINNLYAWDFERSHTGARITVCVDGNTYVFKLGHFVKGEKQPAIYPSKAFAIFKMKCAEKGIDLDSYKIDNGLEVKAQIQPPLIQMKYYMTREDKGLDNCHHIDFHNSYPAGLCNTHPEFRPVIEPIYKERKNPECKDINKAILNFSIGWMQSAKNDRKAEWAHLAKDAIENNNIRIVMLAKKLQLAGREILGFNTDGIWYRGEIYHGNGEGENLGEWSNDHKNCIFRSKSNGAYEFTEDGKYYAVLRGQSTYDSIEPDREKWTWGDIYKGTVIGFKYNELEGVFEYEENIEI